jgi:tRNA(Ile2) C34 agmatinyltransferase TiaS
MSAPHSLRKKHFNKPTLCNYCNGFIWGIGKTGLRCDGK